VVNQENAYAKIDGNAEVMDTPYDRWAASQGIDVFKGYFVENLFTIPLKWWERFEAFGILINLEGSGYMDDAFVLSISPAAKTKPQRHVFEELTYVLNGKGATTVWQPDGPRRSFEWQTGSLFAIPLNAWYQHFNGQGGQEARLLGVTNAPLVFNLLRNEDFILNNPYVFSERFKGEAGYFAGGGRLFNDRVLETNFVPDVISVRGMEWKERGTGNSTILFELAEATMGSHVSEVEVGYYKKAHRHGPGAHVTILTGKGYSLLWPEGKEKMRIDWGPGSMLVPPEGWFHQHFNPGIQPARYLALKVLSRKYKLQPGAIKGDVPLDQGGWQIEYENEDPDIRRIFAEECARRGAIVRLPDLSRK